MPRETETIERELIAAGIKARLCAGVDECFLAASGFHRCKGTCAAWRGVVRITKAARTSDAEPELFA